MTPENEAPFVTEMRAGTVIGVLDGALVTILELMQDAGYALDPAGRGFRLGDDPEAPVYGFDWNDAAIPFDPRLVAGAYAEYRVGRIRVGKGRPVYPEDRWFQGAIPASAFAAH